MREMMCVNCMSAPCPVPEPVASPAWAVRVSGLLHCADLVLSRVELTAIMQMRQELH